MGSYPFLRIGKISSRIYEPDDFDPTVMVLFDKEDKHIRGFSIEDNENQIWKDLDEDPEHIVEYVTSLEIAKDRLEFMGITMQKTQQIFQKGREEYIATLNERRYDSAWTTDDLGIRDGIGLSKHRKQKIIDQEQKIWEEMDFDIWMKGLEYIIENKSTLDKCNRDWMDDSLDDEIPKFIRYMVQLGNDLSFRFPSDDYRYLIRAAIEFMKPDEELVYDLTELVFCEHFDSDFDFCADARWLMSTDTSIQKILVLTEGKSDIKVLEGSLRLLYPHLSGYYSFMDFQSANVEGSASALVKTVKAFIGAGINHRIVALFDNDTAAKSHMLDLENVDNKPDNIRIECYPDIQIAENYPTLGPQGKVNMNINGLAASIELYFGRDVLTDENGSLIPIQWTGYNQKLQQYQGEIRYKGKAQKKFDDKLQKCQQDRNLINQSDWDELNKIIDILRTVFHE